MKNLNEPLRADNPDTRPFPAEVHRPQPEDAHLLPQKQIDELRSRWDAIQASFIDEPRRAVKDADALVTTATKNLSDVFSNQRTQLEQQWSRGDDVSTEDLRLTLQQYRSFFSRLLSL